MAGIPGLEVNDIDMEQWRRAGGTRIPVGEATERTMDDFRRAQQGARPNPNIGTDGLSGEGRALANRGVGPQPQAPGVSQLPKGPGGPVPGAPAGVRAAGRGLGAVAGAAGPLISAYAVGDAIGSEIYDKGVRTDPYLNHGIGGQINSLVRRAGAALGQDWGVPEAAGPGGGVVLSPEARARAGEGAPLGAAPNRTPPNAGPQLGDDVPADWKTRNVEGASGVRRMTTPDGRTLYTNVSGPDNAKLMSKNPGLSVVPGMPQADIDAALARKAAGEAAAAQPVQTNATVIGARGLRAEDDLRAKTDAPERDALLSWRMKAGGLSHQDKRQMIALDNQNATDAANREVTRRGQDITSEGTRAARDSSMLQAQVAMRGQDVSARGQDMSAATAREQGRRQQQQQDRQFQLDVTKVGLDQAKVNFDQRQQADKDLDGKLATLYRDAEGKPDTARVATMKSAVVGSIASSIQRLEAIPQNSPDYAEAQKKAAALRQKGAAGLDDATLQRTIAQEEMRQRSAQGASRFNPFAGKHVDSANPADYDIVGRDNGIFQDQYRLRGGSTVPVNNTRYEEGNANAVLPDLKTPTTRFDILKNGVR